MKITEYAVDKDDWIMTAKSDYAFNVGLVRKSHSKANQIRGKINECFEFGIIEKWTDEVMHVFGSIIFTTVVYISRNYYEELLPEFYHLFTYRKQTISIEDYQSIFKILGLGIFISLLALICEKINKEYNLLY